MRKIFSREYFNEKKRAMGKRNKEFVDSLRKLGCMRCPENDPCCIDFHHRNPKEKEFKISKLIFSGYSIERIQKELNKCDRLCANCHKKDHWYRLGMRV